MQADMRKLLLLPILAACLVASCSSTIKDCTPEYLKEDSPLDPPGTAEARKALRAKVVKEGAFSEGDTPEVQQGKVYLFDRNPDYDPNASGRMVEAKKVKVRSCEGLYYFVELEDGSNGYLRESDMLAPVTLVTTQPGVLFPGADITAEPMSADVPPLEEVELTGNQKLMTNTAGRTVVVVKKDSERNNEFEARKKALMEAAAADQPQQPQQPANEPKFEPLPEPTAGY